MEPPRINIRPMMIAVAIVGVVFGMIGRRYRFDRLAALHHAEIAKLGRQMSNCGYGVPPDNPIWRRLHWQEDMRLKYERAARSPWLPIEPGSPEPVEPDATSRSGDGPVLPESGAY